MCKEVMVTNKLVLTDEEIQAVVGDFILDASFSNLLNHLKDSNKAQLKKAEPLIRQDERVKVLLEMGLKPRAVEGREI